MDGAVHARDKVQLYLDTQYISSIEAFAWAMGWATHRICICIYIVCRRDASLTSIQEYLPVKQLQVHLENEHRVTFRPNGEHSVNDLVQDTQLMGFFKANQKYANARQLYYIEFPREFVWNRKKFEWIPRKRQKV